MAEDRGELMTLLSGYVAGMSHLFADAPAGLRNQVVPKLGSAMIRSADLAALEARLPFKLPHSYKEFLLGPSIEFIEWAELILPGNEDLSFSSDLLLHPGLLHIGYTQFAMGPCGDPVCFDLRSDGGEEYRVVVINHDNLGHGDWADRAAVEEHAVVVAPCFHAFLQSLCRLEESWPWYSR